MANDPRPLVLHVVYRFDVGGLENGVVNLINHMPADAYRHAIVSLTEITDFRSRIVRDDVEFIALNKAPGHGVWMYPKLYRLMKQMRPAIVHTRNLAALEAVVPAWLAGVPLRIHGEHGRDVSDLDGSNRKYQWMRRLYRPFVNHFIALSRDLERYLLDKIDVAAGDVTRLCNGVDTERFFPAQPRATIAGCPFETGEHWLIGTVGRMQQVKNQPMLARAFVQALQMRPELRRRLRLVLVGDGPLKAQCEAILAEAGVGDLAWLPGERRDVADVMRGLDCFALPSLAEGISNTILEAMASGLPVVATDVGGNADLVRDEVTGRIVPAADAASMADALVQLASDLGSAEAMGRAGREDAERLYSLQAMVSNYQQVYDRQLARAGRGASRSQQQEA